MLAVPRLLGLGRLSVRPVVAALRLGRRRTLAGPRGAAVGAGAAAAGGAAARGGRGGGLALLVNAEVAHHRVELVARDLRRILRGRDAAAAAAPLRRRDVDRGAPDRHRVG